MQVDRIGYKYWFDQNDDDDESGKDSWKNPNVWPKGFKLRPGKPVKWKDFPYKNALEYEMGYFANNVMEDKTEGTGFRSMVDSRT